MIQAIDNLLIAYTILFIVVILKEKHLFVTFNFSKGWVVYANEVVICPGKKRGCLKFRHHGYYDIHAVCLSVQFSQSLSHVRLSVPP